MINSNIIEAKKHFYKKRYKEAFDLFIKEKDCLYESGLCALLLKDEKSAQKCWKKSQKTCPASKFGLSVLKFIHLQAGEIPSFFQTRAQLEIYLNLFLKNNLLEWAQNLISCNQFFICANPESYKFIARALYSNGYFDLAITFCKKSLELIYCDPEALLILSQCQFLLGKLEEALESVNKINEMVQRYYPAIIFKQIILDEINKK